MTSIAQLPKTIHQGVNYLSNNVQSSPVHAPLYLDRITTNQNAYNRFLQDYDSYQTKPKWGGAREQPSLIRKTKSDSMLSNMEFSHLNKNHLHFGGALSNERTFPDNAKYDLTSLKRSNVRATDELVPNSNKIDVGLAKMNHTLPNERPFSSHTSKLSVFPTFDLKINGTNDYSGPSTKLDVKVVSKISGSPYRRELIGNTKSNSCFSNIANRVEQNYNLGNAPDGFNPSSRIAWGQQPCLSVSQHTAKALTDLKSQQNESEYKNQYTGIKHGEMTDSDGHITNNMVMESNKIPWKSNCEKRAATDIETILDNEKSRPYTSIYKSDFTKSCHLSNYHVDTLKPEKRKVKNKLKSSKSVTFDNNVVISDGYQTLRGIVNDINTESSSVNRPSTAPVTPRNDTTQQQQQQQQATIENNNYIQQKMIRPYSTGTITTKGKLSSQLLDIQNKYSKTAAHRKFHNDFPEKAPDIRRKPDLRITTNERRHLIPEVGCHSYYFHG